MSLNKARKRLIRKYRKMYNSRPIGLKFSTDGGKTFIAMGNLLKNVLQMLETLTLRMLTQVSCQLVKLALEILR